MRLPPWWWTVPAIVLGFLVHYVAVAAGAWYAFTDWNGITASAEFVGLDNFREILESPSARGALTNTIVLAAAFVVTVNVVGLGLALALNSALKTRNLLRTLFFAPIVLSPLAVSYVWQFLFDFNGPINDLFAAVGLDSWQRAWLGDPTFALWTIFVVLVWQFSGLAMVMYLAGLQSIPDELSEACAVDGASSFYQFRRVTLPLLAPAMTIAVTFFTILGLRVFDQVMALTGGGPVTASETLATQVYKQTFVSGRFGFGAAFALVLTVLIAIVSIAQLIVLRRREGRM
jgi:raffinose/stachyose/melibiose transport system permease protein